MSKHASVKPVLQHRPQGAHTFSINQISFRAIKLLRRVINRFENFFDLSSSSSLLTSQPFIDWLKVQADVFFEGSLDWWQCFFCCLLHFWRVKALYYSYSHQVVSGLKTDHGSPFEKCDFFTFLSSKTGHARLVRTSVGLQFGEISVQRKLSAKLR